MAAKDRRVGIILAVAAVLLLVSQAALAQEGYDLSWWTADGGGHTFSTGSGYSLGGTIGQPDAGQVMAGSGYKLTGGFWLGGVSLYKVYLPLVLRVH
jgi:hypothetical protein